MKECFVCFSEHKWINHYTSVKGMPGRGGGCVRIANSCGSCLPDSDITSSGC